MYAVSPLRYPGAKWRLGHFVSAILADNHLRDGHYAEPYAGGASLALSLMFENQVSEIHLNDLDRSVYAFWKAAIEHTDDLVACILSTRVNMTSWYEQQEVQANKERASIVDLGFSTFFLNRTNRSGILTAGVIGGKEQAGRWKINARFNKKNLVSRIRRVAQFRSRIHVTRMDALTFLQRRNDSLPRKSFVYLDPPYFVKGRHVYLNAYDADDHAGVAKTVTNEFTLPWMVSYDDVPEIRKFYRHARRLSYALRYSASTQREGRELVFLSPFLRTRPDLLLNA